jgi:hypothetical protein
VAEQLETVVEPIRELVNAEPFLPFLIVMSSGDRYVIDNPDGFAIATTQMHYYPRSGKSIHLQIREIAAVERFGEKQSA